MTDTINSYPPGGITHIVGDPHNGKTTSLVRRVNEAVAAGKKVYVASCNAGRLGLDGPADLLRVHYLGPDPLSGQQVQQQMQAWVGSEGGAILAVNFTGFPDEGDLAFLSTPDPRYHLISAFCADRDSCRGMEAAVYEKAHQYHLECRRGYDTLADELTVSTSHTAPTDVEKEVNDRRWNRRQIYNEVFDELIRQDAKWGTQNHPSADPVLVGRPGGCNGARLCAEYEVAPEARAKYLCQLREARGTQTWPEIAVEELAESIEAMADGTEARGRGELIQLIAVLFQWVETIDRRAAIAQ